MHWKERVDYDGNMSRCPTCGSEDKTEFLFPTLGRRCDPNRHDAWHDTEPSSESPALDRECDCGCSPPGPGQHYENCPAYSDSPALDDEVSEIHVHYGPVRGVGIDPEPYLARIESLETALQLAQGALREARQLLDESISTWDRTSEDGKRITDLFERRIPEFLRNALPPTSPTGESQNE